MNLTNPISGWTMLKRRSYPRLRLFVVAVMLALPLMTVAPRHGYSMSTMKSWVNWLMPGTFPELEAGPAQAPQAVPSSVPRTEALNETERRILLSLMERKRELDERDTLLNQREEQLRALRDNIQQQVAELKTLQSEIEASMEAKRTQDADNLKKVVDLYNGMDPKRAAEKLQMLEPRVAVQILMGMSQRKAAQLLEALPANDAKRITEAIVSKAPTSN